jgi:hypothetical protein
MFERAIFSTMVSGIKSELQFPFDVTSVLNALADRRTPKPPKVGNYEVTITPETIEGINPGE